MPAVLTGRDCQSRGRGFKFRRARHLFAELRGREFVRALHFALGECGEPGRLKRQLVHDRVTCVNRLWARAYHRHSC